MDDKEYWGKCAIAAMQALITAHGGYTGDNSADDSVPMFSEDAPHIDIVVDYSRNVADDMLKARNERFPAPEPEQINIIDLEFTARTQRALLNAGITTLEQLKGMSNEDLYRLEGLGRLSIREIRETLTKKVNHGITK
jgi:DNA-directed RNA polymerase alpha subunit